MDTNIICITLALWDQGSRSTLKQSEYSLRKKKEMKPCSSSKRAPSWFCSSSSPFFFFFSFLLHSLLLLICLPLPRLPHYLPPTTRQSGEDDSPPPTTTPPRRLISKPAKQLPITSLKLVSFEFGPLSDELVVRSFVALVRYDRYFKIIKVSS